MRDWDGSINISQGLNAGALVKIIDNSGAKVVQVFGYHNGKSTYRRYPKGGIGSFAKASVIKGNHKLVGKQVWVLIVDQVAPFKINGSVYRGVENRGVVVEQKDKLGFLPVATKITSPIYSFLRAKVPKVISIANKVIYI